MLPDATDLRAAAGLLPGDELGFGRSDRVERQQRVELGGHLLDLVGVVVAAVQREGELVLDQDYGKGTTIKISGWRKNTPKNHLISLSVDNYKADKSQHWPRQANTTDDDIPF